MKLSLYARAEKANSPTSVNPYLKRLWTPFLVLGFMCLMFTANAQVVKHARADISTTTQFYSYIHKISDTVGIEIKYFIVEAPNGDVKTAFDACDVCWAAYKGYAQLGTFMRCINCNNTYPINDLGTVGTGGCWPSYLPHTMEPDSLVINETDLIGGQHYFQEVVIAGINHHAMPASYILRNLPNQFILEMPDKADRKVRLLGMGGHEYFSQEGLTKSVTINKEFLASGVYLLTIEEDGNYYYKRCFID